MLNQIELQLLMRVNDAVVLSDTIADICLQYVAQGRTLRHEEIRKEHMGIQVGAENSHKHNRKRD